MVDKKITTTEYVKFLRNTSPYINAHRGKTFLLAFGGEAISHENFSNIILDITLLHSLGIKLVLVHGIKRQLNDRLRLLGVDEIPDEDLSITDSFAMSCIKDAVGNVRTNIEAVLSTGSISSSMHSSKIQVVGGNFITAKPIGVRAGIDYQHTGEIRKIDSKSIQKQLDNNAIVLLSPIGYSPTGETFNLSYQDLAVQTAINVNAEKLIIFCQNEGISNPAGELLKTLSLKETQEYLNMKSQDFEQHQALKACHQACKNNVDRSHIVSYTSNGALLEELFTRDGTGTLILKSRDDVIRQASIEDIGGLIELISPQEKKGVLVKRSRELLELEISRFFIVEHREGSIISCCALYPLDDGCSAEVACVVTHSEFTNQGHAGRLLEVVEKKASQLKISQLFALTVQASHWFIEKGFENSSIEDLPIKRQSLYNFQRNSKVFCKKF